MVGRGKSFDSYRHLSFGSSWKQAFQSLAAALGGSGINYWIHKAHTLVSYLSRVAPS